MSKFFSVSNLTRQEMVEAEPWSFHPAILPSEKVRQDKQERQNFYRNPTTDWNFYTGIEAANPLQRCSKENPPKFIHSIVVDYDVAIPQARVDEVVASMKIKPSWSERSLGGNLRLIWLTERPIVTDNYKFTVFVLQQCREWLTLDLLPGLDEAALTDPTRLYCNGAQWIGTEAELISALQLQAFFVECGKKFVFNPPAGNDIPLMEVEKAIRDKFPDFAWPTSFDLDTQGPSWWVPGSVSPLSAIVKKEGMFTFAAHATKPFYSWADILGSDFVKDYNSEAIAKATQDIYYDGKHYWKKVDGNYTWINQGVLLNFFEVSCGLPPKKVKIALNHIHEFQRISGAAPFIFQPAGRLEYQGQRMLNTYIPNVMPPAEKDGPFDWIKKFTDQLFDPCEQVEWWLAWAKHFYSSGLQMKPRPGQNIFLMGPAGIGKTFVMQQIIGRAVGGFVDASRFLVYGDDFGSENYRKPLWNCDDETPHGNARLLANFGSMLKKCAANSHFRFNEKFQVPCMVEWMGRVSITANLDYVSSRILVPMDNTSAEKTCVFKCTSDVDSMKSLFPDDRYELEPVIRQELPYFLRWLLNWQVPSHITRDKRYGYAHYHDKTLVDRSHQTSPAAPFKELLLETMTEFFKANEKETEWRGTVSKLIRVIHSNPLNDYVMKSLKLDQMNRYLELIEREGVIKCAAETGDAKTRVWVFYRPEKV